MSSTRLKDTVLIYKNIYFISSNGKSGNEIKETILFIIVSKTIKCLEVNLAKEV